MLHIHFANRYEALTGLLIARLQLEGGSVFAPRQVIVPSAAVRRSLTLAMADQDGICANVQFDFLARWVWQQIGRLVPGVAQESPFTAAVLTWRIYTALGDPAFVAAHARLAAYLQGADAVMRFELAGRVAVLMEQYTTYRPDWLAAWLQGHATGLSTPGSSAAADEAWQAALWQLLAAESGVDAQHPAAAFIDTLQRGGPRAAARAGIPPSAHVFALPTMPPLHVDLLNEMGRHIDLHLYVINPCREYWFEVVSRRQLSHLAVRGRAEGHEQGNRLLATWGRQTQSHVDLLIDRCGDAADDDGAFEPSPPDTLLGRLQNAILELTELEPGSVSLAAGDRSLELHVCHSLTRELEVLQDHLLGLFAVGAAGGDALRPADILVVTPDLDAAAPLIEAVFGTAPRDRFIPYAVSGRSRSGANAPARALLAALSLAGSRCGASDVFALLQQPLVARRFGLDDDALQQVHAWMRESGMRWALDADHRASFEVPADARHTLADGLERLMLGYALPEQVSEPFAGLLPVGDAEGSGALALGAFWRFADALGRLQAAVSVPRRPAAWAALLQDTAAGLLQAAGDEVDDLRELHEAIRVLTGAMERGGVEQAVPLAVVRHALEQGLDDPARGGVPTGSVTFSSMSSLRHLPFAVVCAIGLNDGAFPGSTRAPEFDLMALQPRRGDRQRRDDERNLFLDLLLAARRSLYLSHTGRSVRDNARLPPSVLVSELLEVVVPAIADDPEAPQALERARRRLIVEHPLQPFSTAAFAIDGDARLRSFNRELGDALRHSLRVAAGAAPGEAAGTAGTGHAGAADGSGADGVEGDAGDESDDETAAESLPLFFAGPLAAPGPEWREVSLAQLAEFFRNPCRYLLRRRLGIELQREAEELQDDEPFLPDVPARSALARRLLPALLQGADAQAVRRLALAGTELAAGALGRRQLEHELESLSAFAARVREAAAAPALPPHQGRVAIDLDGEPWQLQAGFADLRASGLVRWRYDVLRPGDRLEAWLQHLCLSASPPAGLPLRTQWLSLDATLHLVPAAQPLAHLTGLLRLYRRGLCEPLHFFPKSSWSYCENGNRLPAAAQVWRVTRDRPFAEASDAAYRLALRGRAEPLDGEFEDVAKAVFDPLKAHTSDGGDAA